MIENQDEYELVYEDPLSEGLVYLHPNQNKQERNINTIIGIFLAKLGFRTWLTPPVDIIHVKTADAWLENENIHIEFKHCKTPTASAIDKAIQKAKKQARYILLYIDCEIGIEKIVEGIENRCQRPKTNEEIDEIWLIFKDELWQFSIAEILSKSWHTKFLKE